MLKRAAGVLKTIESETFPAALCSLTFGRCSFKNLLRMRLRLLCVEPDRYIDRVIDWLIDCYWHLYWLINYIKKKRSDERNTLQLCLSVDVAEFIH